MGTANCNACKLAYLDCINEFKGEFEMNCHYDKDNPKRLEEKIEQTDEQLKIDIKTPEWCPLNQEEVRNG